MIDDISDLIEHDNSRARRILHELLEQAPRSLEARLLLARSYLRSLEFAPAITWYRAVLELDPKNVDALHNVGLCHVAMGDYEAALADYKHASVTVSTAHSLIMTGLMLHRLNRLQDSVRVYDQALMNCPPASAEILHALQGITAALRDAGHPLAADRYAHELIQQFRRKPKGVSSALIERNNSVDLHEWSRYADKSHLGAALQRRLTLDPGGRVPETFVLPDQREALATFAAAAEAGTLFIAKPKRGTGGQGISVVNDVAAVIDRDDIVVQRYLDPPYLVDGRKGHLRIYGLIVSARPLRAYVYTEGIVRFAPERYDPRPERLGDVSMHVTNTALHLGHPELKISQDPSKEDEGAIWSLSALLRRMKADGMDPDNVFAQIKALVEWFVRMLDADGLFELQAKSGPPGSFGPKLFGLDVLLDAQGRPWLLEMQRKPAATGAPLVEKISADLFANLFRMTFGYLADDSMPAVRVAEVLADPAARFRREIEVETANRGRFAPLSLGG